MNILFLSEPSYPEHAGGSGKCAHFAAAGLAQAGHQVHLLCGTHGAYRKEQRDGVTVHRLPLLRREVAAAKRESMTARTLIAYCEEEIPLSSLDVVHDFGGFLSYFFPVAFHLVHVHGLRFVLHFQFLNSGYHSACDSDFRPLCPEQLHAESSVEEKIQCYPVRLADVVICPSFSDAAMVNKLFRPAPGRLMVIPNAVDVNQRQPWCRVEHLLLNDQVGAQRMLFGGRIDSPMKGGDVVFRGFRELLKHRPHAKLVLLSSNQDWRRRYADLAPSVKQLGWLTSEAEVRQVLQAVDVVVVPSRYEPFGMMCAEALAAGTPVIAAPVGGLKELVRPGYNGFLLSSWSDRQWHVELARYAFRIMDSPSLALRLRRQARSSALEYPSQAKVTVRFEAAYRRALETAPRGNDSHLLPPEFGPQDEEGYLNLLEALAGPMARQAGTTALAHWKGHIEEYCQSCSRRSLAENALALMRPKLDGKRLAYARSNSERDMSEAVAMACPLGLLQKWKLQDARQRQKSGGITRKRAG